MDRERSHAARHSFQLAKRGSAVRDREAVRRALISVPALEIHEYEVDVVPICEPDGFRANVARINVDLWERRTRTKDALQDLAERVAKAFQSVVGQDRKVKVVIRPYDVEKSGWVSF
jgi:hypothetical protein